MRCLGFIGFLLVVFLTGCALNTIEGEQKIPVGHMCHLTLGKGWPIKSQGTYLQKITVVVQDERHTFTVHLTLEDQKLDAIAFNDVYGRLYHLTWTPQQISWEAPAALADTLRPENSIADFLLTHLPVEHLTMSLTGAQVREEKNAEKTVRVIEKDGDVLRRISYDTPLGDFWEKVSIQNPQSGYILDIQTVSLQ
ncbi:MAG: DUF3261 domain-containing protein [Alphaproteobacteria bacterium]|jgi:hypothetical protein|nr:DUF3261 domain-containing protein [Alphaproteobacteria bacterium]MBP7729024.1 DUF3261 domain-containing protein [Alphaproteobacteria bacterium]